MTRDIQPYRDISLRVSAFGTAGVSLGVMAMVLASALDDGPRSPARYVLIGGLLVASFSFFVALGFRIQGVKVRRAIAEMQAGAILGEWMTNASERVQVGPKLAIVAGEVRRFCVHLQAVTEIVYVDATNEVVVRATIDAGYGPNPFEVRIPGAENPHETMRCAHALADHHDVAIAHE